MAFDAVGERIMGAAMTIAEHPVEVFDCTAAFPGGAACLLVGGVIAGPVGLADAAAVAASGANHIEAATIGGWSAPIDGVSRVRDLGRERTRVA